MGKKRVHRWHVARNIRPYTTEASINGVNEYLKDKDWYSVGSGYCTVGSSAGLITITQDQTDLEYFFVEVE